LILLNLFFPGQVMAEDKRPGVAAVLAALYPDVKEQVNKMVNTDTERSKRKCV
jgi:hypothetical protein